MKTDNKSQLLLILIIVMILQYPFPTTTLFCNELPKKVLIIYDEKPQMEVLSNFLQKRGKLVVQLVDQNDFRADGIDEYDAVVLYIHRDLDEVVEKAIIKYTNNGGRHISLHHSISSRKVNNKYYFDFLGIHLDIGKSSKKPVKPGGNYGYADPILLTLVNLNQKHFITTNNINWNEQINYKSSCEPSVEKEYPAFTLHDTEVYFNHKFTDGREKIVLVGFKFYDKRNEQLFMQDRAAWIKQSGEGVIIYFQMGHEVQDFENENISQLILNAVIWEE